MIRSRSSISISLDAYARMGAAEMAAGVRDGALSPVALVEAAAVLAERLQPVLNCYADLDIGHAKRMAEERAAEQRAGRPRGSLHGLPVSVKDTYNVPGFRTGMGSRLNENHRASDWSPLAERVHEAGAIMLGKTTMPEFGWKAAGTSPLTGITRNPWNTALTPGGSSSGSAAAVAARIVPAALGGDGGGSIRIPAAFCGLFGLKPSFGRIAVHPGSVHEQLVHHGFLTRSALDTALMLDVGKGPDPRDPWSLPMEARSYLSTLAEALPPLRVGFAANPWGIAVAPSIQSCIEGALRAAQRETILNVVPIDLPDVLPRTAFETLWSASRAFTSGPTLDRDAPLLDPGLVVSVRKSAGLTLRDQLSAQLARRRFAGLLQEIFASCDIVAMPTVPVEPFAAEVDVPEGWSQDGVLPWIDWAPFTYPFNLAGNPAATLLAGFGPSGLPVGLQLMGPRFRDDLVLHTAHAMEAAIDAREVVPAITRQVLTG